MKLFRLVPVFGVILLALPHSAHAQSGVIGLGPALPIGPNPDEPEVGWQVSGALEFGPSSSPVAFRLETLVSRIPFRYNTAYGGSNAVGVGVNGGLGLVLPFLHAFVEARAHFIRNAPDCLPITLGLRF